MIFDFFDTDCGFGQGDRPAALLEVRNRTLQFDGFVASLNLDLGPFQ